MGGGYPLVPGYLAPSPGFGPWGPLFLGLLWRTGIKGGLAPNLPKLYLGELGGSGSQPGGGSLFHPSPRGGIPPSFINRGRDNPLGSLGGMTPLF